MNAWSGKGSRVRLAAAVAIAAAAVWAAGCAGAKEWQPLPRAQADSGAGTTLIWSGKGEAWRAAFGGWVRDSAYDYSFTVVQERQASSWRSIKTLQREHPGYDGKAGPRAQTYSFVIGFRPAGDALSSTVTSSLGAGTGTSDFAFRNQRVEIEIPRPGRFSPYTHILIAQKYLYEEGRLKETVELTDRRGKSEKPFMKVEERADIFLRGRMDAPGYSRAREATD